MKYRIIERNEKHVNAIIKALKKADALYLATDPDREGEAISPSTASPICRATASARRSIPWAS
jgi:DNA topoisomerase IA